MQRAVWLAAIVLAASMVATATATWRMVTALRERDRARTDAAHAASVAARATVETVTVKLAQAERVLTRTIERVRVDTLVLHPTTPAETTTAVAQLPALAAEHETLQRECSAYRLTCAEYRAAAEHRDTTQQAEIAGLRRDLARATPGRWRAAWERVDQYVGLGLGVYLGYRLHP